MSNGKRSRDYEEDNEKYNSERRDDDDEDEKKEKKPKIIKENKEKRRLSNSPTRRSNSGSPVKRESNSSRKEEDRSKRYDRKHNREEIEDESKMVYGKKVEEKDEKPIEKEKPNFNLSGKLSESQATFKNVKLKWIEPSEATAPKKKWHLFPFKGDEALESIPIHRKSCYLFGRDRLVVDIVLDNPSASKQQAILQWRLIDYVDDTGLKKKDIRPYIVDLKSTNGTFLLNRKTKQKDKIEDSRYYELKAGDVFSFGQSTRDYVLMRDDMA